MDKEQFLVFGSMQLPRSSVFDSTNAIAYIGVNQITHNDVTQLTRSLNRTDDVTPSTSDGVTLLALVFAVLMSVCILSTIIGNILVVLSVFTYKPLRGVQNFYIVSLACADLAVAVFVMPFNIANSVVGHWQFGAWFCNMWLTFDIFTCTASILNLCAIAVDRYYAIHDPINYAQKRTLVRVLIGLAVVWLASAVISIPPLFGWNSAHKSTSLYDAVNQTCQLTDERSYVLYSASGSFYIPLVVMVFVYVNIFTATRARLRARAGTALGAPSVSERSRLCSPKKQRQWRRNGGSEAVVRSTNQEQEGNGECVELLIGEPVRNGRNKTNGDEVDIRVATPDSDRTDAETLAESPRSPRRFSQKPLRRFTESFLRHSGRSNTPRLETGVRLIGTPTRKPVERVQRQADSSPDSTKASQMSQFLEEKQRISLSKERRAARTMGIIMGAFVLCWLPFFLMYVIFPFCPTCKEDTDPRVANFIVWLGYINSTLNPIIYTVFNVDFRRAFKALLQGNCGSTGLIDTKRLIAVRSNTVRV